MAMEDTERCYKIDHELQKAVADSIEREYIVPHEEEIEKSDIRINSVSPTYEVTNERCLQTAIRYVRSNMKVGVLNFANCYTVGGAPFSAGAQEESICRCSTLYPCLQAQSDAFYSKHRKLRKSGQITHMGNDDLIFTPDVVVFKTEKWQDGAIVPRLLPRDEWFRINIITCAAPELWHGNQKPANYEEQITSRIKKILDVAEKEGIEALVLGAWGCGAFKNPPEVVAGVFRRLLDSYNFKVVSFAMASDVSRNSPFARLFGGDQ